VRGSWADVEDWFKISKGDHYNLMLDSDGRNLLFEVFEMPSSEDKLPMARLLVDNGVRADSRDNVRRSALFHAAEQGLCDIIKFLVDDCAVEVDAKDSNLQTPLFFAANFC